MSQEGVHPPTQHWGETVIVMTALALMTFTRSRLSSSPFSGLRSPVCQHERNVGMPADSEGNQSIQPQKVARKTLADEHGESSKQRAKAARNGWP